MSNVDEHLMLVCSSVFELHLQRQRLHVPSFIFSLKLSIHYRVVDKVKVTTKTKQPVITPTSTQYGDLVPTFLLLLSRLPSIDVNIRNSKISVAY